MQKSLLTIFILMIPLGAIGGIAYPVYQSFWSGIDAGIQTPFKDNHASIEISPEMNTSRIFADISYQRQGHHLSNHVGFHCKITSNNNLEFDGQKGFNVNDNDEREAWKAGTQGTQSLALGDFHVDQNKILEINLDPIQQDAIAIDSISLRARKNVGKPNLILTVSSCVALLVGILGTVFLSVRMMFRSNDDLMELAKTAVPELFETSDNIE